MAIQSFKCKATAQLFNTGKSAKFGNIAKIAMLTLVTLDSAKVLADTNIPTSNGLHPLTKEKSRIGQHAISINKQYRICFTWGDNGPEDVEITDYH